MFKIKCAFVGENNFNIIKMHGTTIKKKSLFLFQYSCCGHSRVLTDILMRVQVCDSVLTHLPCN
jgi:hypothetical protein